MKRKTKYQILWHLLCGIFLAALLCLVLATSGCSGYRSTVKSALVSNYQPVIYLGLRHSTNLSSSASLAELPAARNPDQTLQADAQVNAPVVLCAEQINLMIFGGSAGSNSVLSDLQIPLTGTP